MTILTKRMFVKERQKKSMVVGFMKLLFIAAVFINLDKVFYQCYSVKRA